MGVKFVYQVRNSYQLFDRLVHRKCYTGYQIPKHLPTGVQLFVWLAGKSCHGYQAIFNNVVPETTAIYTQLCVGSSVVLYFVVHTTNQQSYLW